MKIGKKLLMLAMFWLAIHLMPVGLSSCFIDCSPGTYRIDGFEGEHIYLNDTAYFNGLPIAAYDTVGYDSLALYIRPIFVYLGQRGALMPSAVACSPADPLVIFKDFTVTSSADYDSAHPKGSRLNDIVAVRDGNRVQAADAFIEQGTSEMFLGVVSTFNSPPAKLGLHEFSVTYKLADNRTFTTTLGPVWVRP